MSIQLRFINRSEDNGTPDILLFVKNTAPDLDALAVAWKVIRYCGRNCYHPFVYPSEMEAGIGDEFGNHSPRLTAHGGERFAVQPRIAGQSGRQGRILRLLCRAPGRTDIELKNDLPRGAVDANVYLGGRLLATKKNVAPQQKAVFAFNPALLICTAAQIEEGDSISSAIVSGTTTELFLAGIASADIVMTGGGTGDGATDYQFNLENIRPVQPA